MVRGKYTRYSFLRKTFLYANIFCLRHAQLLSAVVALSGYVISKARTNLRKNNWKGQNLDQAADLK